MHRGMVAFSALFSHLVFHIICTGFVGIRSVSGPLKQKAEQFFSASQAAFAWANVAGACGRASLCGPHPEPPWQHSPPFSLYGAPARPPPGL